MKTSLKKLMWSLLIIIVGVIMFNASTLLGWIYVAILIAIGCLIFICKCSAGNEEKIIKLEAFLQKGTSEDNRKICKGILDDILPDDLPANLNRRYKEADKMFKAKYESNNYADEYLRANIDEATKNPAKAIELYRTYVFGAETQEEKLRRINMFRCRGNLS